MISGLHIFRKDFRIHDNYALFELCEKCDKVYLIFIFDENQIDRNEKNKYYISNNAIQFMCESLIELYEMANNKLLFLYGNVKTIIEDITKNNKIDYISYNSDFTKYSNSRDNQINNICKLKKINIINNVNDQLLHPISTLCKLDNTPYKVFGSFYKNAIKQDKLSILKSHIYKDKFINSLKSKYKINKSDINKFYIYNSHIAQNGGRSNVLNKINKYDFSKWIKRDDFNIKSLNISAYLNFGCISIREFYKMILSKSNHKDLIKQIYWRDFYNCFLYFDKSTTNYDFLDKRYENIKWGGDSNEWKKFYSSNTGFLLIDAIMQEFKTTGFINNRSRLLLSTFWIKYLLIDPYDLKYGSQSGFSRMLIDCSTSQNKFNHEWIISTLDLTGRRFSKRKSNPLTGRVIKIDNTMIKHYNAVDYIKKWLSFTKDMMLKDMIKYPTIFDANKRYDEYCKLFVNK